MEDKEIKNFFGTIDEGLKVFNADKGFKIDASKGGDWLVFDQRLIRWTSNGLDYMLQIFPHFDNGDKISSWTLYGAVSYDTLTDRYLTSFSPASKVTLDNIALNVLQFLIETYDYVCSVKKEDIPHAVKFENY